MEYCSTSSLSAHLKILICMIRLPKDEVSVHLSDESLIFINSKLREKGLSDLQRNKDTYNDWLFNIVC